MPKSLNKRVDNNFHLNFSIMTSEMVMAKQHLMFEKRTVAELSEDELMLVNGGATPAVVVATGAILVGAGAVMLGIEIFQAGYAFGQWLAGK
jgi:lactobin A/cerein 7B family class IIb bacteriocin